MRCTRLGLLAIPIVIGVLTFCHGVSACNGSIPGQVYLNKTVSVGPGQYHSEPFTVAAQDPEVRVDNVQGGRILIIRDSEMDNFTAGKNFTEYYNSSRASIYEHSVVFTPGNYWAVLDNRGSTMPLSGTIKVERPTINEKCGELVNPVPGFDAGPMILALGLAAISVVIIGGRRN